MRSSGTLIFLSTPSARRATGCTILELLIFGFLSTPSARRATRSAEPLQKRSARTDFYPRPPRGGRRRAAAAQQAGLFISIHALREEGDVFLAMSSKFLYQFLSTPSARRATSDGGRRSRPPIFLSTPSARRATSAWTAAPPSRQNFYPRPPRGGRPSPTTGTRWARHFYPRPPRGGRHHPSGECAHRRHFYPRPPRGGRLRGSLTAFLSLFIFLSTPSARRATPTVQRPRCIASISIHALREEGDFRGIGSPSEFSRISIHALREEGDASAVQGDNRPKTFLSTPSARRAT